MFRSKHSGWTWEGKRTPFGGNGGAPTSDVASAVGRALGPGSSGGGKGAAFNPNAGQPPQAPPRDVVQETMQQRQQAAAQVAQPTQVAPMPQQTAPVSPFVQQQRQQMQPQMGLGYQQPGLQSMLARILGIGGGGYGMPPQMMQRGMPPQMQQGFGMPQQGGMPAYGQYGMSQNPLNFRPDMARVQQNLSNVRPSIQRQNQDAQAARIAELEAQLAQYNTPAPSGGDSGGGGG